MGTIYGPLLQLSFHRMKGQSNSQKNCRRDQTMDTVFQNKTKLILADDSASESSTISTHSCDGNGEPGSRNETQFSHDGPEAEQSEDYAQENCDASLDESRSTLHDNPRASTLKKAARVSEAPLSPGSATALEFPPVPTTPRDIERTLDTGVVYIVRLPLELKAKGNKDETWTLVKIGKTRRFASSRFVKYAHETRKFAGSAVDNYGTGLPTGSIAPGDLFSPNYIAIAGDDAWQFEVMCSCIGFHAQGTTQSEIRSVGQNHGTIAAQREVEPPQEGWVVYQLAVDENKQSWTPELEQALIEKLLYCVPIQILKPRGKWRAIPFVIDPQHSQFVAFIDRDAETEGCDATERLLRGLFGTTARMSWFVLPALKASASKWAPTEVIIVPNTLLDRISAWFRKTLQKPTSSNRQHLRLRSLLSEALEDFTFSFLLDQSPELYSTMNSDKPMHDDKAAVVLMSATPGIKNSHALLDELQKQLNERRVRDQELISSLQQENARLQQENARLQQENAGQERAIAQLRLYRENLRLFVLGNASNNCDVDAIEATMDVRLQ